MRSSYLVVFSFLLPLFALTQSAIEKEKLVEKFYFQALELGNTERDSSYYYYQKAYQYAQELENYSDAFEILFGMILTSRKHGDIKNHRVYINKVDSLVNDDIIIKKLEDYPYYQNRAIYEKSTYFYNLRDFNQAQQYFRKLHKILSKKPIPELDEFEYNLFIHTTNYLALIYSHKAKYDLAENYFKRSLAIIENNPVPESETYRLATLQLLAQLYRFTKYYSKSNNILKETLKAYKLRYKQDLGYKNNVNAVYHKLIENAIDQDSLHKAMNFLDEGQQYLLDEDPFRKKYLLLYATVYAGLGDTKKSMRNYTSALEMFQEYRQNVAHQDLAEVYGKMAEFHLKQGNYEEGLDKIQEAFASSGTNIKPTTIYNNPNPHEVFSKTQLLYLLDTKLQLLVGMYDTNNDSVYLDIALSTSNDMLQNFDLLKKEFDSKLDKQFLAEKAYPVFHKMLEVAYIAYENKPSDEVLQLALNISEKNKDFLLLEALRGSQATKYGDVPDKILNMESQLRAKITYLEKENFNAIEIDDAFSEELFELKQEYYGFLEILKSSYPKYHDLKYGDTFLDLLNIQKNLIDDGQLVTYVMTTDFLYAISLEKSDHTFLKLPFDNTDKEDVRNFYRLLSSPSIKGVSNEIANLGRRIYDKILKRPLEKSSGEDLIIVADDILHYVPFDLLHDELGYLLKSKNISYGNSITSLIEIKEKRFESKGHVLAFAPTFGGLNQKTTEREFGKLLYNDDEVQQIQSYFETDIYSDSTATLENFMNFAPNQNIIHLATHASANDEFPDYSYLAFSENTNEDNILYIKDLYNMSLEAEMITLSACQTGIGKLQKGQGMMSLSKGFFYAGAKSLVKTLWKINDKSTVKLMEFFYEGLSNGKSKTEALREAKLRYLETTDDGLLKHPYYWAAFVVSGDTAPISTKKNYWWIIVIGVAFLIPFIIYSKRRKNFSKVSLAS